MFWGGKPSIPEDAHCGTQSSQQNMPWEATAASLSAWQTSHKPLCQVMVSTLEPVGPKDHLTHLETHSGEKPTFKRIPFSCNLSSHPVITQGTAAANPTIESPCAVSGPYTSGEQQHLQLGSPSLRADGPGGGRGSSVRLWHSGRGQTGETMVHQIQGHLQVFGGRLTKAVGPRLQQV